MTRSVRTFVLAAAALAAGFSGLFLNEDLVVPGRHASLVSEAQAIIGRPLTPLSYAGVARRTVRRCALGMYYC
ncbi:hypothetical protein [Rhizobium sp. BK376]|jgi:hypothetical protein|uniref:hypothetical protein n=1 Tax=Rhizobium sp. BK376 TaxID=2512149 RepID=UPI001051C02F|nr:hypothetical protein [Rhizobium sp. BK376]TCR66705.1 hypothetical protein EV561_1538 [Rhizobium sp. BK376]